MRPPASTVTGPEGLKIWILGEPDRAAYVDLAAAATAISSATAIIEIEVLLFTSLLLMAREMMD
jgi:hypothetical protein